MTEMVTEIKVAAEGRNIFDTDINYVIPLYQRAFAWEDKELIQLIEDIEDVPENANYYIGTLIVSRQNEKFEVVDGQQRLTALYLLFNCLDMKVRNTLTFACRDKSNYTLLNIQDLLHENRSKLDMERIEQGIQRGINILSQKLDKINISRESFINKLSHVVIFRIEVPDNTDLNRYFEIMNTRGEQLEQHDILKAKLMSYLSSEADQIIFAKIWDACSDMTGYVQMHFISQNNRVREAIFDSSWNSLPVKKWGAYKTVSALQTNSKTGYCIEDIIAKRKGGKIEYDGETDDNVRVRFDSIIDFPFFLLHTLRVFIAINNIQNINGETSILDELLDDKKLIDSFDRVIQQGVFNDSVLIKDDKLRFAKEFIICLIRTRYLFDKYIIKREYANENSDGEWSLKSLNVSGQQSKKKPYYRNTRLVKSGGWDTTNERLVAQNLMLQSALRVSYTSPKVMHWITELLVWLSESDCKHTGDDIAEFGVMTENIAKRAVKEYFFDECPDGIYEMGVNTPHIVFNYLDYLIWNADRNKYSDFKFEFRNSVEHWYPQHPSEGTFDEWKDGVDRFGNLCIIQRSVNSKFSNMSPEAKKSTFKAMIEKGSLKLRLMSDLTEKYKTKTASLRWKETCCQQHEEQMIELLKTACGINTENDL